MSIYEELDSTRNDIVHGMWGWIEGVKDCVLWCSSEKYAVWHINDYHKSDNNDISYDWRNKQFNENTYIWKISEIASVSDNLSTLDMCIGNFHSHLRYRGKPAGSAALSQLKREPMFQKALSELQRRAETK